MFTLFADAVSSDALNNVIFIKVAFVVALISAIPAIIGGMMSRAKNRSWFEGFAIGLVLSWFGVLLAVLLPTNQRSKRRSRGSRIYASAAPSFDHLEN